MTDYSELKERVASTNANRWTAFDRLRAYSAAPDAINFDGDDAHEVATALDELVAAIEALERREAEGREVVGRWVSWCDDWYAGKSHPADDLDAARRWLEGGAS